jgi:hypothetical protein
MFTPRYYFTLTKCAGNRHSKTVHYLYLKNGRFKITYTLHTQYLLTWPQKVKYNFLFWFYGKMGNNSGMFGYKAQTKVSGVIHSKKLF